MWETAARHNDELMHDILLCTVRVPVPSQAAGADAAKRAAEAAATAAAAAAAAEAAAGAASAPAVPVAASSAASATSASTGTGGRFSFLSHSCCLHAAAAHVSLSFMVPRLSFPLLSVPSMQRRAHRGHLVHLLGLPRPLRLVTSLAPWWRWVLRATLLAL